MSVGVDKAGANELPRTIYDSIVGGGLRDATRALHGDALYLIVFDGKVALEGGLARTIDDGSVPEKRYHFAEKRNSVEVL